MEVFPKADRLMPGMLGSYLNLPYYGDTRPVISNSYEARTGPMTLEEFVEEATAERNSPDAWRKRALAPDLLAGRAGARAVRVRHAALLASPASSTSLPAGTRTQ